MPPLELSCLIVYNIEFPKRYMTTLRECGAWSFERETLGMCLLHNLASTYYIQTEVLLTKGARAVRSPASVANFLVPAHCRSRLQLTGAGSSRSHSTYLKIVCTRYRVRDMSRGRTTNSRYCILRARNDPREVQIKHHANLHIGTPVATQS